MTSSVGTVLINSSLGERRRWINLPRFSSPEDRSLECWALILYHLFSSLPLEWTNILPQLKFVALIKSFCRVELEVDQTTGSTYLLEMHKATGATYFRAFISCLHRALVLSSLFTTSVGKWTPCEFSVFLLHTYQLKNGLLTAYAEGSGVCKSLLGQWETIKSFF